MPRFLFPVLCLALTSGLPFAVAQPASEVSQLTVQTIMQDPATWVGSWPVRPFWTETGDALHFYWNPQGAFPTDSLYRVGLLGDQPEQVPPDERRHLAPSFDGWNHGYSAYNGDYSKRIYANDGDLYVYDRTQHTQTRLTHTLDGETNPRFMTDGRIVFERNDNLYLLDLETSLLTQWTDIRTGSEPTDPEPDDQEAFLENQQQVLFEVLRKEKEDEELEESADEREKAARHLPPTFYRGKRELDRLQVDPTGRFVTFRLAHPPADNKQTLVQNYVTDSGYAGDLTARAKVGSPHTSYQFYIQDLEQDTTFEVDLTQLPGAYDVPLFLQEQGVEVDSSQARAFIPNGPYWSKDGRHAVMMVRAYDNKDRWIVRLEPETGTLTLLDRQHDEAWIAGPGHSWFGESDRVGWLPDDRHFFFQSEKTGYSHLYTVDVETGSIKALTSGEFEVFEPHLSQDGSTWFFAGSEGSPFEQHIYTMPLEGGPRTRLTDQPGQYEYVLSPDSQTLGLLYSYSNQPPEVHIKEVPREADPRAMPADQLYRLRRVTESTTDAWNAYPWRDPDIIRFEASDGVQVPARIYVPDNPNGAGVLFVHGAGYLHNVHKGWSDYYREYMFHNLLADRGYVVMDVDYRGSAGYGRDWRTAIYRHMGGRDLQDYVDASNYLQDTYGIDPERIGIYGGSYGGFITLMALFTEPEHFGAGAALRSVTDWAHYNDPYTSNILNTPTEDSLAYARSSPIYFAEGLEDPLLIAHGIVDTNVHFQDVVRLAQRLIELGKTDWEMAVYPVEGHGFTEPTSWTDEYRRILKLFEMYIGPNRVEVETPD